MRVLTIGDPHFKTNNVKEVKIMCDKIYALIESSELDLIVVMGDILDRHEHIHVVPLTESIKFLLKLSTYKETYVLIGNHDRPNNSDYLSDFHPFNGLKGINNLHIIDKVICREYHNLKFIFAPYVFPGRFQEALDTINLNLNDIKTIFCHQEFYGTKMGAVVSTIGDKWPLDKSFIISGHIHDYCRPQDNIVYVGTPMQHAFGDRDDKTVSVWDIFEDKIPDEKRLDLGLIKRLSCNIHCSELLKWIPPPNYIIRLIINGTNSEIKAIMKLDYIKDLRKQGIKIHYNSVDELNIGVNKKINIDEVKLPYAMRLKSKINNNQELLLLYNKIFSN